MEQRRWEDLQAQLRLLKPTKKLMPPKDENSKLRNFAYNVVKDKSGGFFKFVSAVIVFNVAVMFLDFQLIGTSSSGSRYYISKSPIITNLEGLNSHKYLKC